MDKRGKKKSENTAKRRFSREKKLREGCDWGDG